MARRPVGPALAAVTLVFGGGLAGCGGGSSSSDGLRSDLVGALLSEGEVDRGQAECIADDMIQAGFTSDDFEVVEADEDGSGMSVSSRIYDMAVEAYYTCVPGFATEAGSFG